MNAMSKLGPVASQAMSADPVARFKELIANPQPGYTAKQHERNMRSMVMYAKAAFPAHRQQLQKLIDESFPKPAAKE